MKTRSIRVDIPEEQFQLLAEEKVRVGVPKSEQIRRAIAAYLRENDRKQGRWGKSDANRD